MEYLRFELKEAEAEAQWGKWQAGGGKSLSENGKSRAKAVFFQGLMRLPWAKWWLVWGLGKLGKELGWEESRKVWKVLGERELRVHVDIEETVDRMQERMLNQQETVG